MEIFRKIISLINKNKKSNPKKSKSRYSINSSCTLHITGDIEKKKTEINNKLKPIIKQYINSPENLIQSMQLKGLKIYRFKNADKILNRIGEEEGFLTPLKGFKAFIINFIIGILDEKKCNFSFKTKELFIFDINNTEIYTIARALHKYLGYKEDLPGFDYKSQEVFKKVYNKRNCHTSPFNGCSVNDLYICKEAIARDLESINFTIQFSVEYENSKKALKKLKETNSANI